MLLDQVCSRGSSPSPSSSNYLKPRASTHKTFCARVLSLAGEASKVQHNGLRTAFRQFCRALLPEAFFSLSLEESHMLMHNFTSTRSGATFLGMKVPLPLECGQRVCPFEVARRRALLSVASGLGPIKLFWSVCCFELRYMYVPFSSLSQSKVEECQLLVFLFLRILAHPWLSGLLAKRGLTTTHNDNERPSRRAHPTTPAHTSVQVSTAPPYRT